MFNWIKDRLRGQKRIAPKGVRGRVYEKRNPEGNDQMGAKAKGKLKITARHWIDAEQRWVDLGELTSD